MKSTSGLRSQKEKRELLSTSYETAKQDWREERIREDGYLQCQFKGKPIAPGFSQAVDDNGRCIAVAMNSPHHRKGRGKLLAYKRYFMALCFFHHQWVHGNVKESKKRKLLL